MARLEKKRKPAAPPAPAAGETTPAQAEEAGYYSACERAGLRAFGLDPAGAENPQEPEKKVKNHGR